MYNKTIKKYMGGLRLRILADLHTHTIFSKHGYSTIKENIDVAKERGLKYLACTDHYYGNGDAIEQKNEVTRICYLTNNVFSLGLTLIAGAEFNVSQKISEEHSKKLLQIPWKPIGCHTWFIPFESGITLEYLYWNFVKAHKMGFTGFTHIERELFRCIDADIKENGLSPKVCEFLDNIVDYAYYNNIPLEVNESSIKVNEKNAVRRMEYWLNRAKKNGNILYMGTDAHWCDCVGDFSRSLELLDHIGYDKSKIINYDEDMIKEYVLRIKK